MVQWNKTKLGELSERITKGSTPTTYGYKFLDEGIPFVKVENLANGRIVRKSITQYISEGAHEFQKRSQLQAGDVLFSIAGTIGRVALVTDKDVPANTNQAVAIIRGITKHFIPDFLKMQLDSHVSLKVKSKARGGAMNNISLDDLKEMDVVAPPFNVQENIVRAVDTQFTRLDAAIKSLKIVKNNLELYKKSVLKAAFDIDCEYKKIDTFCDIISGSTPRTGKKEYWDGNIRWITPKDLSGYKNKYIENTSRMITEKGYNSCSATLIPENNVLMSSRAPIGYLVINKKPMCTNQGFKSFQIRNREKLNEEFLYYQLKFIIEKIKKSGSGTTFNEISKPKAANILIKVPIINIQIQIVQGIDSRFSVADKVGEIVDDALLKGETLRKSILKAAFEGNLIN